jgi:hypothetical protein
MAAKQKNLAVDGVLHERLWLLKQRESIELEGTQVVSMRGMVEMLLNFKELHQELWDAWDKQVPKE